MTLPSWRLYKGNFATLEHWSRVLADDVSSSGWPWLTVMSMRHCSPSAGGQTRPIFQLRRALVFESLSLLRPLPSSGITDLHLVERFATGTPALYCRHHRASLSDAGCCVLRNLQSPSFSISKAGHVWHAQGWMTGGGHSTSRPAVSSAGLAKITGLKSLMIVM